MSYSVLIPFDGSEGSVGAVEYALERYPEADLTAMYVVTPQSYFGVFAANNHELPSFEESEERGQDTLEKAETMVTDAGREVETVVEQGEVAKTIVEAAEEHDEVVIGSHRREGAARILLGSVAETVARRATVPVTITR